MGTNQAAKADGVLLRKTPCEDRGTPRTDQAIRALAPQQDQLPSTMSGAAGWKQAEQLSTGLHIPPYIVRRIPLAFFCHFHLLSWSPVDFGNLSTHSEPHPKKCLPRFRNPQMVVTCWTCSGICLSLALQWWLHSMVSKRSPLTVRSSCLGHSTICMALQVDHWEKGRFLSMMTLNYSFYGR